MRERRAGRTLAGRLLLSFVVCAGFAFLMGEFSLRVGLPALQGGKADAKSALAAAVTRAAEEKAEVTNVFIGARLDQVKVGAALLAKESLGSLRAGRADEILSLFLEAVPSFNGYLLFGAQDGRVLAQGRRKAAPDSAGVTWTRSLDLRTKDGSDLGLSVDLDLSALVAGGTAGAQAGVLILGPDYLPVAKGLGATLPFSEAMYALLPGKVSEPFELADLQGRVYLAALHRTGEAANLDYWVLAYAPTAVIKDQEDLVNTLILAMAVFVGLVGLATTLFSIRHITTPLKDLEAAVLSFSQGAENVALPEGGPQEIALITQAYGVLMDKARDWRQDLEREVKSRTAEISMKGAVVKALMENDADESAYHIVLGSLVAGMGARGGLIQYINASRLTCVVGSGSAGTLAIGREDLRNLQMAAQRGAGPFAGFGMAFEFCLARELLAPGGSQAGIIALGWNDTSYEMADVYLLERVLAELSPLVAGRETKVRQEQVRRAAEQALRRSEERLRTFFDESHDMIYSANTEDVIASVNAAGLSLLGCKDRFEAVGRPFSNFVLNLEDRALFRQRIKDFGFVNDYELVLRRADGSTIFCLETAQSVKGPDGTIVEIQGIIKDITERINNERELWRTNMEIAEANLKLKKTQMLVVQQEKLASIGQLAAGIAHEINNPLGFLKSNHAVMGRFSKSLKEAWDKALAAAPESLGALAAEFDLDYIFSESETLLAESEDGYRRIMDIVKNLKNFARAGSESTIAAYNLNKGLESTLVVAWNEIKYVADVEKDFGDLPDIEADGGGINQVFLNILVNAAQAIEGQGRKEKGKIRIATALEGDKVSCTIVDDGPGIPAEVRYRIFDPFYTTKAPGKGTGLGLSISYDIIVNKHGGRISVEDGPEGGAAFKILLPIQHIAVPEGTPDPRAEEA